MTLLALLLAFQVQAPETAMAGRPVEMRAPTGTELRVTSPAASIGRVKANSLNVRTGPTTVAAVRAIIYRGDRVLVATRREDGWCEVIAPAGAGGFTSCEFLELSPYGPLGSTGGEGTLTSKDVAIVPSTVEVEGVRAGASVGKTRIRVVPYEFDRTEAVAEGILYRERRFVLPDGEGPVTMQILEVDPKNPAVDLLPVRARDRAVGRETTSSLAARHGATAAVNGGYFVMTGKYAGASNGVYQHGGQVMASGAGRTALLVCEEENQVERLEFEIVNFGGSVAVNGSTYRVQGVNRPRGANELVVYTSAIGPSTLTESGVEARLSRGGRVLGIEDGGNANVPEGGSVLSGSGAAADWLRRNVANGSLVRLDLRLTTVKPACAASDIVGGGPLLLRDGKLALAGEKFGHEETRHPRTAVATTREGKLLFVTVDGRQSSSAGLRLVELANELIKLGALEAINLDGGGSTTMVVNGKIRNSPSDGLERPVSDAILILATGLSKR